jgi:alkylhydroperoxidase family enzyme
LQGQKPEDVDEIGQAAPEKAEITEKERALLDYVKVLTLEPAKVRDTHVDRMRKAGWTDEQVFEASFVTSMFAFYNRMADAYGLDYNPRGWRPPELRPATEKRKP